MKEDDAIYCLQLLGCKIITKTLTADECIEMGERASGLKWEEMKNMPLGEWLKHAKRYNNLH